ncbi:hypothetical protein M0813_01029 [Anaeramoeba flamelloides]|uniref:Uncharacterized protein n=1 Tax=Anaeramoeba flamelloides TaxID=1746091 RepID=A0ABQ8X0E2_9EUKA|nr:hypothetical protein M0813_01029 [Anaeramoeba flamelloides]
MGNELPTTVSYKPIKRYLRIVNKHIKPIAILDQNCCWVDANLSFLQSISVLKKNMLFCLGLKDFFPKSQSHSKNVSTIDQFMSWFHKTKKLTSRSSSISLEYQLSYDKIGFANFNLKFFEIGSITLSQISIKIITEPNQESDENRKSNNNQNLSDFEQTKYQKEHFADRANSNSKSKNILTSPSMEKIINNNDVNELLKLQPLLSDSNKKKITRTKKNKRENKTKEKESETENVKEIVEEKKTKKNNNKKRKRSETEKEKKRKLMEKEIKKKMQDPKSRTIDETHLDLAECIEEIMEILQENAKKAQLNKKVKFLLDQILNLHKKSFFEKQEICKRLSYELLNERKKNQSMYSKLESQLVMILENVQSEKSLKNDLLSLNLKYKKDLLSLRKTISNFQKLLEKTQNLNVDLEEEKFKEKDKEKKNGIFIGKKQDLDTDLMNKQRELFLKNHKKFSNLSFVNSLVKQLIIV